MGTSFISHITSTRKGLFSLLKRNCNYNLPAFTKITLIHSQGVVDRGPQEYKRVKGGDTMANIKRTKLVLRFNIGTEDAPKYKDVTYTRVAEEASDDNVKTVGNALAALYDHSLSDVVRVNEVSLGH